MYVVIDAHVVNVLSLQEKRNGFVLQCRSDDLVGGNSVLAAARPWSSHHGAFRFQASIMITCNQISNRQTLVICAKQAALIQRCSMLFRSTVCKQMGDDFTRARRYNMRSCTTVHVRHDRHDTDRLQPWLPWMFRGLRSIRERLFDALLGFL